MAQRVQADSHKAGQILPHTAGNGLFFLIKAKASLYLPCAASCI